MLIGRRSELGRLLGAARNPPAVLLVEGEAGVGKSRLVAEMVRDAGIANGRVLLGHCHQLPEPFPLGSIIEALGGVDDESLPHRLSPLLGALGPVLPKFAGRLPPALTSIPDPRAERHRVFRALRELLGALGPTVCILEDVHWADEGTLEFLSFVVAAPPPDLVLVLTRRTEDLDASSQACGLAPGVVSRGMTIDVPALSPVDVRVLVAAMLDTESLSYEFAARLHEWTGGIPLAVEEVVRLLLERGDLSAGMPCPARALPEIAVPHAVRAATLQRLTALSADARLMVWAAAVLGVPAEEERLSYVGGLTPRRGATGLIEALSAGALQEHRNGVYGFRHALATQAVYRAIAGPRRRRLHLRAGRALERCQPQPLAQVAHHLKQGGAEKWPLYAEAAAKAASLVGEDRLAADLLEDALSASKLSRAARIRMALALGEAALYGPPRLSAIAILQRILEEEPLSVGVRGELRYSVSRLMGHAGDARWRSEAARAVSELRRRPELGVRAMIPLAQPLRHSEGQLDEHLEWLERAGRAVESQTDPVARIAVSAQRAAILLSLGDSQGWAAIRDIPRTADTAEEKLQLLRGYHDLAVTTLGLGYYARAESFLAEADRIRDLVGHRSLRLWLEVTRASLDWSCGRWDGLEDRLRGLVEEIASAPALSISHQFALGSLLLARGELGEAQRVLESALEAARRTHSLSLVVVSGRLGRVHLDREDADAAREVTAVALDAVRGKAVWVLGRTVIREAVQALLAGRETESARELVGEFATGLRGVDAPAARAALAWCRGALAEADDHHGQAARHFARSEEGWGRLPNPYEAARARERRASCSLAGDSRLGERLLVGAVETFQGLGADGDTRRVRAQLKSRRAWRGGRTGYADQLSPREAQVARLAGMGQSNREIAQALFISPRTVGVHIAASLRKLGLASRHQLADPATPQREESKDTSLAYSETQASPI